VVPAADSSDASSTPKSQSELETISTCRNIETKVIQADLVFQDSIAFSGVANARDSSAFLSEISPLSDILLEASFGENLVDDGVANAANLVASALADVQGLMSQEFDPFQVSQNLGPSLEGLLSECGRFMEVSTSAATLFVAPKLIEFNLEAKDSDGRDPIVAKFEDAGMSCDFSNFGPELITDLSPLKPLVTMFCGGSDGYLILRRHSSNLEALRSARQLFDTVAADVGSGVFVSDEYSGTAWVLDDAEASANLASLIAFRLEMESFPKG
jgi:hypothetical protein